MVQLSKKSWHSKWWHFTYNAPIRKNLCPYFWAIFFSLPFIPLMPFGLIGWCFSNLLYKRSSENRRGWFNFHNIVLGVGGVIITTMAISLFTVWFVKRTSVFWIFGIIGWVTVALSLFGVIGAAIAEQYEEYKDRRGLLRQMKQARDSKICPQIQWVD